MLITTLFVTSLLCCGSHVSRKVSHSMESHGRWHSIVYSHTAGMATSHANDHTLVVKSFCWPVPLVCTDMIRPSVVDPHQKTGCKCALFNNQYTRSTAVAHVYCYTVVVCTVVATVKTEG